MVVLSSFQGLVGVAARGAGEEAVFLVALAAALEVGAAALVAGVPRVAGRRSRMPLPEHERTAIEAAISRAERKTSGEIVGVATGASSPPDGMPLLVAAT